MPGHPTQGGPSTSAPEGPSSLLRPRNSQPHTDPSPALQASSHPKLPETLKPLNRGTPSLSLRSRHAISLPQPEGIPNPLSPGPAAPQPEIPARHFSQPERTLNLLSPEILGHHFFSPREPQNLSTWETRPSAWGSQPALTPRLSRSPEGATVLAASTPPWPAGPPSSQASAPPSGAAGVFRAQATQHLGTRAGGVGAAGLRPRALVPRAPCPSISARAPAQKVD
ncbi:uncharacterized protein LOC129146195 [Talpa occidentalis]|uniref:uncharacterized protein LOC129146195 n=1 Tax=Talpa occidentalis TaxID=50954 RepID=UPI0023F7CDF6|nr:uncharacterized protein LOC129146195 [Talpa occidentalis]